MVEEKDKKNQKYNLLYLEKVGRQLGRIQNKWVSFMKHQEGKCSLRQKKIALILFCMVFAGGSVAILVDTFVREQSTINQELSTPVAIPLPPLSPGENFVPLTGNDTINLLKLRGQLDSLALTEDGKQQLKKFNDTHPGLLDRLKEFKK